MTGPGGPGDLPLQAQRNEWWWGVGTGVVVAVMMVYYFITDPSTRPFVLGIVGLFALGVLVVRGRSQHLEPTTGVVDSRRLWLFRDRFALEKVTKVELVTNNGGGLALALSRRGRRRRFLPLLLLGDYADLSLDPERLEALADQLERWVAADARGEVAALLREQADFVRTGAALTESPFASRVRYLWSNVAKGVGGSGSAAGWLS